MKKSLKLLIVFLCILSLSGCGKNKEENVNENPETNINQVDNNEQDNNNEEIEENKNPILKLKDLTIKENETYKLDDFVESCETYAKEECILEFKDDEKYKKVGTYEVTIIAKDKDDNVVEAQAKLVIEKKESDKKDSTTSNSSSDKNTSTSTTTNNTSTGTSKPTTETNSSTSTATTKPSTETSKPTTETKVETPAKTEETVTKVDTKTETRTEEVALKYGVKEVKTITKTYDLYSDGSKKNEKETSTSKIDKSGYNAKTSDVLSDAVANKAKYMAQVNEMLTYVNEYRKEVGANPLVIDEDLTKAAMVRAIEIGYGKDFSHTRPDGTSCFTVLSDINYSYMLAGENIAAGNSTPKATAVQWRNSAGHYANMIKADFTKLGVGFVKVEFKDTYTYYWVQLFS